MSERPAARPNILFLLTDQQRWDTLGCNGNDVCRTPAIDGIARRGTRFTRAFTPTAICTPARASLLTGLLPCRHGVIANPERAVGHMELLGPRHHTFGTRLRDAGYQTVHVGKWHVSEDRGPADHGFDGLHYPGWHNPLDHHDYRAWLQAHGYPEPRVRDEVRGRFPNGLPALTLAGTLDVPEEATFERYLADRTIEALDRCAEEQDRSGRPFFLACEWFGPHLPYLLPEALHRRYAEAPIDLPGSIAETFDGKPAVQRRYSEHWAFDTVPLETWRRLVASYWAYVSHIDEQVGRILRHLESLGRAAETAVFFSTDHGEFTGAHRLHDKGPAMYDDIYRVPLVAQVPGGAADQVDDHFVSLVDLTATFLELAGLTDEGLDGRSLLPILHGAAPTGWRQELVAEFHGHHFPYPQRMIRTERWKLVVNPADCNELYDLLADPLELQNRYLHPELSGVRDELMGRLYRELVRRGDNFHLWMPTMFTVDG